MRLVIPHGAGLTDILLKGTCSKVGLVARLLRMFTSSQSRVSVAMNDEHGNEVALSSNMESSETNYSTISTKNTSLLERYDKEQVLPRNDEPNKKEW